VRRQTCSEAQKETYPAVKPHRATSAGTFIFMLLLLLVMPIFLCSTRVASTCYRHHHRHRDGLFESRSQRIPGCLGPGLQCSASVERSLSGLGKPRSKKGGRREGTGKQASPVCLPACQCQPCSLIDVPKTTSIQETSNPPSKHNPPLPSIRTRSLILGHATAGSPSLTPFTRTISLVDAHLSVIKKQAPDAQRSAAGSE